MHSFTLFLSLLSPILICNGFLSVELNVIKSRRSLFQHSLGYRYCQKAAVALAIGFLSNALTITKVYGNDVDLKQEVFEYERILLEEAKQPNVIMQKMNRNLQPNKKIQVKSISESEIDDSRSRVLTLKAYLDEIERDLFRKSWERLQSYLFVFSEQEDAFAFLIEGLFPSENDLDSSARVALAFEAKGIFLALDDLRQAAREQQIKAAQSSYARLSLNYDRFLKAGDLYPAYDPITSTEVFFKGVPLDSLRYDRGRKIEIWNEVLLITGPDMGKTGRVLDINGNYAVVKFDANGLPFQEVKLVKIEYLAKTSDPNADEASQLKVAIS